MSPRRQDVSMKFLDWTLLAGALCLVGYIVLAP